MGRGIELTGLTFGKLRVIQDGGRSYKNERMWRCICECGTHSIVGGYDLRSGNSTTCGCGTREAARRRQTIHGRSKSPEWWSWICMMRRCYEKSHNKFHIYGSIGV